MYLGSWKINDYLTFTCNTHTPSTGAATDADSVPAYRVYEDETGTAIENDVLAKLDDANTTGFYSERIQLLDATGYEKGKTYTIYIAGTVGGVTGTMSHTFQIEAEVDANIVSDKTGFSLAADQSAVTIGTVGTLTGHTAQTGDSFALIGSTGSGLTSLAPAATALTNATWTDARAGYIDELASANLPTDVSAASIATAVWNAATATYGTAGSYGLLLETDLDAAISTRAAASTALTNATWTDARAGYLDELAAANLPTDVAAASLRTALGLASANLDTQLGDIPTVAEFEARTLAAADYVVTTDTIAGVTTCTNLTNAPTSGDLTATMKTSVNTEVVDALTVDTLADSYAADGAQPTIGQAVLAIHQMMQEMSISDTTLTVKKPDGSTAAMTFTLNSATTPTSITRAT